MEERETKLEVHPGFEVPDLAGLVDGAAVERAEPAELRAVYFDTADLRLIRAGVTLRHRAEPDWSGWQLKLPALEDGSKTAMARIELPFEGGPGRPPRAARGQVHAFARGAPLVAVARLRTWRTTTRVSGADGVLVEVADDEVSVYRGRHLATRFREVEVEVGPAGDDRDRRAVVKVLRAAGAHLAPQEPKVLRALGPAARSAPDVADPEPGKADPGQPVGPVIAQALLADLARIVRHEPGTRRGDDPEELHQMRVATRRLRSTLKSFHALLDEAWSQDLRGRLQEVAADLGDVRDLDVQVEALAADAVALGEEQALEPLLADLRRQRDRARARLLRALDAPAYTALLEQLVTEAAAPRVLAPDAPAGEALGPLVAKAWRKVRKAVDAGVPLHEVRIKAKRLRYAAEAAVPAFGKDARRLAEAAADVQGLLGDHQDAVVTEALARHHLTAHRDAAPATMFALGLLSGLARERRRAVEAAWPAAWDDLRRPKLRRFL